MPHYEAFRPTSLTIPMIVVGTLLGSLVCVANTYFSLRIGILNTMSASTALISFAIFRGMSRWLPYTFTPAENVVLQTMVSSIAGMPHAASLWSVIPAFEFLRRPEEGGQRRFSIIELFLWSLGVSLFGTIFSAPFRTYFLLKQRLRFPGGYATGVLVGLLHNDDEVAEIADMDRKGLSVVDTPPTVDSFTSRAESDNVSENSDQGTQQHQDDFQLASKVLIVLKSFIGTAIYVLFSYFVPMLNMIPVFGITAARDWLWFLTLSPAFTAWGIVLDLSVACSMLLGAILGWAILSPLARNSGWAPGPIDSMETGVRGWLVWVSIGLLLGDATIRVLHETAGFTQRLNLSIRTPKSRNTSRIDRNQEDPSLQHLIEERTGSNGGMDTTSSSKRQNQQNHLVSSKAMLCWLLGSTSLCVISTWVVFQQEIRVYFVITAVAIGFPLCLIVIQSAGETDAVPSSGLSNACQFLFGLIISKSSTKMLASMILGGVVEASLWQSAVLMSDLKTAYLVQASPKVMFHAQLLGSAVGAFIASGIYRIFTHVYSVPSDQFPIPLAHMGANTARLVGGGDLPNGVGPVVLGVFILSASLRILSLVAGNKHWKAWVPSAVAMSIGMYIPPSTTLANLAGAVLRLYFKRKGVSEVALISAATGCILGEGTLGFIPLIMATLGVPRLSNY